MDLSKYFPVSILPILLPDIFNTMNKFCVHRWLCIFILLSASTLNCFCQSFVSDPEIPNPTITFLNDSVVRLDYDSIYHVHEWWDTIQYPGVVFQDGRLTYDYTRIFSDLMTVLDAREYHFIPVYGDDDLRYGLLFDPAQGFHTMPGGDNAGSPNTIPAKNIGRENNSYDQHAGGVHPERGYNYSMPHMNDIKILPKSSTNIFGHHPNFGSTMRLFHEIGHTWGVIWNTSVANALNWDVLNWEPWMPPITLVAGGNHWWPYGSNRWVDPKNGGLLTSSASINRFNIFDLYAMGAVSYNDIVDSVLYVRDPNTLVEYPVTVDSLILLLNKAQNYLNITPPEDLPNYLQGDEYLTGDGKRIPATDPNTQHFKTLIVVVTGAESIFSRSDKDLVLKLAKDVPPDWEIATRGYSHMSTKLEHKMVNDFGRYLGFGNSVTIKWEHFVSAYGAYKQASPDGIRIEGLPTRGTLSFNGLAVAVGQTFSPADFAFGHFTYTKDADKRFTGDEFQWNAITQGRWAVAAKVTIKPFSNSMTSNNESSIQFENEQRRGILTAYPNPFDDIITLTASEDIDEEVRISVSDQNGQAIHSQTASRFSKNENLVIDLAANNSNGILYLSVTISGRTQTKRILRK